MNNIDYFLSLMFIILAFGLLYVSFLALNKVVSFVLGKLNITSKYKSLSALILFAVVLNYFYEPPVKEIGVQINRDHTSRIPTWSGGGSEGGILGRVMSRRGGVKNGRSNNISEAEGLVYDKLIRAKLAYKIPDTMDIGKQYVVEVIITKQLLDNVLYYGFYKNISKDFVLIDSIAISSRVKVSLIDPEEKNFQIKPMNTELQVVDSKSSTAWKWYIRPKTGGYNPLILTVSTRIKDQYGSDYKDIPVFEKTVNVNSNYWYSTRIFLEENWQYVLSGILIPFIVWLFNLYNNKERGSKQGKKVKTYNKRV